MCRDLEKTERTGGSRSAPVPPPHPARCWHRAPGPRLTSHGAEVPVCLGLARGEGADGGEDDEREGEQQDLGEEEGTSPGGTGGGCGSWGGGWGQTQGCVPPFLPAWTPQPALRLSLSILTCVHPSIQPQSVSPPTSAHAHPFTRPSTHPHHHHPAGSSLPGAFWGREGGLGAGGSTHRDAGPRLRCLVARLHHQGLEFLQLLQEGPGDREEPSAPGCSGIHPPTTPSSPPSALGTPTSSASPGAGLSSAAPGSGLCTPTSWGTGRKA